MYHDMFGYFRKLQLKIITNLAQLGIYLISIQYIHNRIGTYNLVSIFLG